MNKNDKEIEVESPTTTLIDRLLPQEYLVSEDPSPGGIVERLKQDMIDFKKECELLNK